MNFTPVFRVPHFNSISRFELRPHFESRTRFGPPAPIWTPPQKTQDPLYIFLASRLPFLYTKKDGERYTKFDPKNQEKIPPFLPQNVWDFS